MEKVNTSLYGNSKNSNRRMNMILKELSIVGKEIENKQIEARSKANNLRIVNSLSSLLIIIGAAVITAMEAVSDCINIPVIVFSSLIFFIESTHKLFQWGPQGVLYMHGYIRLSGLYRQKKDYEFFYDRYTPEQLLTLVSMLRAQCDDVDMGIYKLSISGNVQTGFDVQHNSSPFPNSQLSEPLLPGSPLSQRKPSEASSHVHIHLDSPSVSSKNLTESKRKKSETPVLIIPTEEPLLTPVHSTKQHNFSNIKNLTPSTPQKTPLSRITTPKDSIPTIKLDSDDDSLEAVIDIPE